MWFSEPVDEASAESLANWQVLGPGGAPVAVTNAVWNAKNGDRVTLTTQLAKSTSYTVVPVAILDTAPAPNALDGGDACA